MINGRCWIFSYLCWFVYNWYQITLIHQIEKALNFSVIFVFCYAFNTKLKKVKRRLFEYYLRKHILRILSGSNFGISYRIVEAESNLPGAANEKSVVIKVFIFAGANFNNLQNTSILRFSNSRVWNITRKDKNPSAYRLIYLVIKSLSCLDWNARSEEEYVPRVILSWLHS